MLEVTNVKVRNMAGPRLERQFAESWAPADWAELTVLVAVSGGADSVALLRAMAAIRLPGPGRLIAAHFNHQLRVSAEDDEAFVRDLCRELGLSCEVGRADVARQATRQGDGVEAAARRARYQFLQATAERLGARYLVTAHTADDQAETILHRILRGTGLAGLAGIPRSRPLGPAVSLLRPMLGLRRADVAAYLAELGQTYRDDETNLDLDFTRNRLRRELLPQLAEQYNARVVEAILRLGQLAGEAQDLIAGMAQGLGDRCVRPDGADRLTIDCQPLIGQPPQLVRECLLLAWRAQRWSEQAMGFDEWERLSELAMQTPPAAALSITLPGAIVATRTERLVTLERPERQSRLLEVDDVLQK
ncbi:MAG TPA: tRNA lysidine(34) synthetase TilS [Pirellulales bacterium]|nr:tRNA lysidine(34) synthetase TilS [Pirellulales bacterium]